MFAWVSFSRGDANKTSESRRKRMRAHGKEHDLGHDSCYYPDLATNLAIIIPAQARTLGENNRTPAAPSRLLTLTMVKFSTNLVHLVDISFVRCVPFAFSLHFLFSFFGQWFGSE